ncbi:hypothetical protein CRG98_005651 [Punica granatum]|uniref:Zinc knuckle CX2CX4HX4C domain-containing protein n=1 Tax=Punica granatum TaxID=22663 RepID=A0A2I0KZP6_PUNGR|nr:hypothetical protein CRG98_005651 [Punica granatum]
MLPKWYATPRALVKVLVSKPLCPGHLIRWKNGVTTWVFFKFEHLKTFCYDSGTLRHDQAHCTSDSPTSPNLYGLWLRFDLQSNLLPWQTLSDTAATPLSPIPCLDAQPSSGTFDPIIHRSSIPQNTGNEGRFDSQGYDQTIGSDNTLAINATDGMYFDKATNLLTVGASNEDDRGEATTEASSEFLHRAEPGFSSKKKTTGRRREARALTMDSLYFRLMEQQAYKETHYQKVKSPTKLTHYPT